MDRAGVAISVSADAGPASSRPLVTVVIVAWNGASMIADCLDAVAAQQLDGTFEVWVIDNASADQTASIVARHPSHPQLVSLPRNLGFAGAADHAVRSVASPFVILLNQDACPAAGWLAALLAPLRTPDGERVAAVTSKVLLAADGRVNNAGVLVARDGYGSDRGYGEPDDGAYDTPSDVFAFSGTAAALRVTAARSVGSFDPRFFLYYEDTDLSWRLQLAGWRVRYEPRAVVVHRHAASSDVRSVGFAFYNERNRLVMVAKCAPLGRVAREVLRFGAITLLLPLRRARKVPTPPGHQFRTAVRLRVLASFAAQLPSLVGRRRGVSRIATRSRRSVASRLS